MNHAEIERATREIEFEAQTLSCDLADKMMAIGMPSEGLLFSLGCLVANVIGNQIVVDRQMAAVERVLHHAQQLLESRGRPS